MLSTILCFAQKYPAIVSLLGSLLSVSISGFVLWWVAYYYTKKTKRIDATLEFSKSFQELRQYQHEVNREHKSDGTNQSPSDTTKSRGYSSDARIWWRRYFDLMLFQFAYFREGLVDEARFVQWMRWRQYDFNATDQRSSATGEIGYRSAWDDWKELPAMKDDPFITFLDRVHAAKSDDVRAIIKDYAPRWWRRTRRY